MHRPTHFLCQHSTHNTIERLRPSVTRGLEWDRIPSAFAITVDGLSRIHCNDLWVFPL